MRFDGRAVPFELDAETRRRLLEGLDDIALTLAEGPTRSPPTRPSASAPGRCDGAMS